MRHLRAILVKVDKEKSILWLGRLICEVHESCYPVFYSSRQHIHVKGEILHKPTLLRSCNASSQLLLLTLFFFYVENFFLKLCCCFLFLLSLSVSLALSTLPLRFALIPLVLSHSCVLLLWYLTTILYLAFVVVAHFYHQP